MKMMNDKAAAGDFRALVEKMEIYAQQSASMLEIEAETQRIYLDAVREALGADYAELQDSLGRTRDAVEALARRNPQWFAKAKTMKTPYGSVGFRTTRKLKVGNEELTLMLIIQAGREAELTRERTELNLEALETLEDEELADLRVERVESEPCTVKPAKMDLGKAVKGNQKPETRDKTGSGGAPKAGTGKGGAA